MTELIAYIDEWELTPVLENTLPASTGSDRTSTIGTDSVLVVGERSYRPENLAALTLPFQVPGDVHSTLLAASVIEEPYFRDNEYAVDWVNKTGWVLKRRFQITEIQLHGRIILVLDGIDCVATIQINDQDVAATDNQFVRSTVDVTDYVSPGENTVQINFLVAVDVAAERRRQHPFDIPGESPNCRLPNNNFLRKTPCHSGWDWNICLMPIGVYGDIRLESHQRCRLEDVRVLREFIDEDVRLGLNLKTDVYKTASVLLSASIADACFSEEVQLYPGQQSLDINLLLKSPDLWWPSGLGEQTLHELTITLDGQRWQQKIGLCNTQIITQADSDGPGRGFRIDVNQQQVFMRGANWIPADALPARASTAVVRELLNSALDANMNMIRVWGGGQYEPDWFYALCDELGILVWQDFMFSCNHYPASDRHWINSVRTEATQQVRRLSRFSCVALWCGDNELVGALKWWELTSANRDRYLANYVRLNTTLEDVVALEAPNVPWWPSSPSQGLLDYADGWKSDAAGDMHFWDVWHEARPFSAYQEIRPRFCSEFGFQSFPSMPMIESFTNEADRNVSSRVMGVHQRNVGGNARIVETMVRYFPFPDSFSRTVFLSQCQQAMAIRTGVEYWRSLKPHCMGTLYWQLNDTWPVASWSSLEYGGAWKLLHYAARRFYQPLMMMIVPVDRRPSGLRDYSDIDAVETATLCLRAVNDLSTTQIVSFELSAIDMLGQVRRSWQGECEATPDAAIDVLKIEPDDVPHDCFLSVQWWSEDVPDIRGENEYWTRAYKQFSLPDPTISVTPVGGDSPQSCTAVTLTTDKPAFFVSIELGGRRLWSDNGFTLLPGKPKTLTVIRELTHAAVPTIEPFSLMHL